jgi:hypothetical protein
MAGANRVLDQMAQGHTFLGSPPEALASGEVPTRVVGYAVSRSTPTMEGDRVNLHYEGEGLPLTPGFGVALVDDSIEVFRGVLIFETEPSPSFPEIGSLVGANSTIPLFGIRVHWTSVNDDSCPIFPQPDSSAASD